MYKVYGYFIGISSYGFYRGYNGLFTKDSYFVLKSSSDNLVVDKLVSGIFNSMLILNPLLHPFIFYGIAKRSEKRLKNITIVNDDWSM
jgi:hypothetical protein